MRAVVLVAGRGMRLRPLTDTLPKALLPVLGSPVAARTLSCLERAGCEAATLNLHHLGEAIRERFGESYRRLQLTYSHEPELLGTSGALGPLREFLRPADLVLVINGDSLCEWPIRRLIRRHLRSGAAATLLVSAREDSAKYGGGIGVDRRGRLLSLRAGKDMLPQESRRVFLGAHVFSPDLIDRVPQGPSDFVSAVYEPMLEEGISLATVETRRRWHDLGTPERYLAALRDESRSWLRRPRSWIGENAQVDADARLQGAVVENGAVVGPDVVIENSVLLPGAKVARGSRIRDSILGHGVELDEGTIVDCRLVSSIAAGARPRETDSVVGDRIFTTL